MTVIDLSKTSLRDLNQRLHDLNGADRNNEWRITNPSGEHAIAVGLNAPTNVQIDGPVGYYCGGMNKEAMITINGHCGWGVGENIMSGFIRVKGNASESAGASGRGGMIVIEGDASSRCGISMKGVDIVVTGSVGHMSAFLAQKGHLVVGGDVGPDLGASIYEAVIYVQGKVNGLGTDCIEKDMTPEHRKNLARLLQEAGVDMNPAGFRRYGSARKLYHFNVDHADAY
ncbi:MAG: protein GlxC [Proteobacteria bacterium]|nr:protein GlxC [Pseudomonadota bacterium]